MGNNNSKGLYEIGERQELECGCIEVAEEVGYTLFVNPDCPLDNHYHPPIKGYQHKPWDSRPMDKVDRVALNSLKGSC